MMRSDKYDTDLLRRDANLLNLLGWIDQRRVAHTNGGEYAGSCPRCGGDDRFRVWPRHPDRPGFWCRGCEWTGDAIDLVRELHDLEFPEACEFLAGSSDTLTICPVQRGDTQPQGGEDVEIPEQPTAAEPFGLTLAAYAEAKQLPVDHLHTLGLTEITYASKPALRIPYHSEDGEELAVRFRIAVEGDRFRWRKRAKPCMYGLDALGLARERGFVILVEGESDVHTGRYHGVSAVGVPGASNWNEERDAPALDGIETIYLPVEPDSGGETLLASISESSIRDRVRLLDLGDAKDLSELHLANTDSFRARLDEAMRKAVPLMDRLNQHDQQERAEAWEVVADLASRPTILDVFVEDANAAGVVGEGRNLKLLFLVVTSRHLDQPVSCVVKGPSSAGKSYIVDTVLGFFTPEAAYAQTAMSERALVYDDEPLEHRVLVLYEAGGLSGDLATYLIRSLLSEGEINYTTTEKTKDGFRPRHIHRAGPTGLITTTTAASLHPENETRLLSLTVTDTREQTKAVMAAYARQSAVEPDLDRWHALDRWVTLSDHGAMIPYAETLAALIPPMAVRLRRDFKALLGLIAAHALLHQAQRARDEHGRVVAEEVDYAVVRQLLNDVLSVGLGATVSSTVRETVQAVATLCADGQGEAQTGELAQRLGIDKSAASRRIRVATNLGYLVNNEDRRGKPSRLVLGDPLPDDIEVLPHPDQLRGCTVDGVVDHPPPPTEVSVPASDPATDNLRCSECGDAAVEEARAMCSACTLLVVEI